MKVIKNLNSKKILSLFWKQDGSPYFKAKGIAVGVFSGCFPFFGLQTLLGIFLAKLVNGNLVLAALGTWISNPLTYIPLYLFNFKVGSLILRNKLETISNSQLSGQDLWNQGWNFTSKLLLGSCLVGIFMGVTIGSLTFYFYNQKLDNKLQ